MSKQKLDERAVYALLDRTKVGRLTTLGADGGPYTIPVHFARDGAALLIHCGVSGRKLDNIAADARICFEADEMEAIVDKGANPPCNVYTSYESAICEGTAEVLSAPDDVRAALRFIIAKYTPNYVDLPLPAKMVDATRIIRITVSKLSGKVHGAGD
jgi:nitroimidazol reductase NimA-like FMN-containing flavoprotein (pyridoxamine 5'-phosphate oxidase superfamily)